MPNKPWHLILLVRNLVKVQFEKCAPRWISFFKGRVGPCPQFIKRIKNESLQERKRERRRKRGEVATYKKANNTTKQTEETNNNALRRFTTLVEREVNLPKRPKMKSDHRAPM